MNTIYTRQTSIPVSQADADGNYTQNAVMPITYYIRGEWDCECGRHTTVRPDEMFALNLGHCPKCGRKIEKVEEVEK